MTDQDFAQRFWPRLRGYWPAWTPTETEAMGWAQIMRQYPLDSAIRAAQGYWEQESKRPRPVVADYVRCLRFVPEADTRTDRQRVFEELYYRVSLIAMRIIDLELCRRRLVRNQYERPGERYDDERRMTTLQAFAERQQKINPARLKDAEREADAVFDQIGGSPA